RNPWILAGRTQRTAAYPDTREDSCLLPSSFRYCAFGAARQRAAPPVTATPGELRKCRGTLVKPPERSSPAQIPR
ncbi:hypothetical protein WAI99_22265, partial [Acinetobacter baumannii]